MPNFLQTRDGRFRKLGIVTFVMWFVFAVLDFIGEGLRSLSGIQYLLLAIGVAALAPYYAVAKEHRVKG